MIGKILRGIWLLTAATSIATLLAAVVGAVWLRQQGQFDSARLRLAFQALRGTLPESASPTAGLGSAEQPSFAEVLEARAKRTRNLELRESALAADLAELAAQQARIRAEQDSLARQRQEFADQLAELESSERIAARDEVRSILENIKPLQAKEEIVRMIKADEMEDVVLLLTAMPMTKKAKIVAEFKTEEEAKTLDEILRRIKQGQPKTALIDAAQENLEAPAGGETPGT